jgi:hypothetical protein
MKSIEIIVSIDSVNMNIYAWQNSGTLASGETIEETSVP